MELKVELLITYFNQKSVYEELLLEPYFITYNTHKKEPNGVDCVNIISQQILNINLTYGCALSLYKAL